MTIVELQKNTTVENLAAAVVIVLFPAKSCVFGTYGVLLISFTSVYLCPSCPLAVPGSAEPHRCHTFITGTCISVRGPTLRLLVLPGLHRVSLFN